MPEFILLTLFKAKSDRQQCSHRGCEVFLVHVQNKPLDKLLSTRKEGQEVSMVFFFFLLLSDLITGDKLGNKQKQRM